MSDTFYEFALPEIAEEAAHEWPVELPDHLSYSSLSMFERCPEMYRRRYCLGEKTPPSGALIWGTADGISHGVNFTQKIETREDLHVGDVQDAFVSAFRVEVESAEEEIDWGNDRPGDIVDKGVALVTHYHEQVSPRVYPIAVEEYFSLEIPELAVPFVGYVDVSESAQSIERKTAGQKSSTVPPWYRLQTLTYQLARNLPVEMHISTKTKAPAVYTAQEEPGLLTPFTPANALRAQRMIQTRARQILATYREFGPDQTWPDAYGSQSWFSATCDFCGWGPNAKNVCEWWKP